MPGPCRASCPAINTWLFLSLFGIKVHPRKISPAPSWRAHCKTLAQWWHDVGSVRVSGWTVLSMCLSKTKKMHSGSRRSWWSQSPTFAKGSDESSRSNARMGDLLYHKVALGHTTHRLCNHLVCFHIHSHEAVICRVLGEAGRQAATVLPSIPVVPFPPLQGFPLACVAPFGTEGTRETQ